MHGVIHRTCSHSSFQRVIIFGVHIVCNSHSELKPEDIAPYAFTMNITILSYYNIIQDVLVLSHHKCTRTCTLLIKNVLGPRSVNNETTCESNVGSTDSLGRSNHSEQHNVGPTAT